MTRYFILLLIILSTCAIYGQTIPLEQFNKIEEQINESISSGEIPSIAIALSKNGEVLYEKAFGYSDKEHQVKATKHTSYQLASVTKVFTATAIMRLHHKGKLDIWSSAVPLLYPLKFKELGGAAQEVRISHLLNHTSGLSTYFQLSYSDEEVEIHSFKAAFKKYGTLFHPAGLISEYSNLGYGILDYIIENVSGKSYQTYMAEEVFKPLELEHTFVDMPSPETISIAKKYDRELKLLPEINNNTKGAGNIYSSVHDLIRFGNFHLKESNSDLLSNREIDLMQNHVDEGALHHYYASAKYGLGWYFRTEPDGTEIVWHEGGMMGASSMLKLIPKEHIAIAVITNTSNTAFCQKITNMLSKVLLPDYDPQALNPIADYENYTSDTTYFGKWKGNILADDRQIPCTLTFGNNGEVSIDYLDFTYRSYFTEYNPIPNKTALLYGLINKESFIGIYPGNIAAQDIRNEYSHLMSLKLYKKGNTLKGTVVALPAAEREYYAYPFSIQLEKED